MKYSAIATLVSFLALTSCNSGFKPITALTGSGNSSLSSSTGSNSSSTSGSTSSTSSSSSTSSAGASGNDVCSVANMQASAQVACPTGQVITKVAFAGFGEAAANSCGSYIAGACNSSVALSIAQTTCLGKASCTLDPSSLGDPCDAFYKILTLDVQCAASGSSVQSVSSTAVPTLSTNVSNPPSGQVCATAPDNGTASLACPTGQVISKVVFASYGTPGGSCGNYTMGFCNSGNSTSLAEAACLGQNSCSVSTGYWPMNGDPCPGFTKSMAIQAQCRPANPAPATAIHVCSVADDNSNASITCPSGQTITKIAFASYGDPAIGSCGAYSKNNGTCTSGLSLITAQTACLGKTSCTVPANTGVYGDPCDSELKKLTVDAICSPTGATVDTPVVNTAPTLSSVVSNAPAGEVCGVSQSEVDLSCPSGQVITKIDFASYGTPGGSCGNYTIGYCHAGDSVSMVEASCLGKSSCSVGANYNVFWGDPCSGINKTLAVQAECGTLKK